MITDSNILLQKNFKCNKLFDNIRDHNEQISAVAKNYTQSGMDPLVKLFFLINWGVHMQSFMRVVSWLGYRKECFLRDSQMLVSR